MYRYFFILISIILISCKHNEVDKPKHLLSTTEFEGILYDITLLNSVKTNQYSTWEKYYISPQHIVYQKHNIDSLDWVQNFVYYVNQPKIYKDIIHNVDKRLKTERDLLSTQKDSLEQFLKHTPLKEQQH